MGEVNGAPVGIVKGQAGTVSNIAGMEAPTEIPKDGGARMGSRGRSRWHSGGGSGESRGDGKEGEEREGEKEVVRDKFVHSAVCA
jgi:hypothetical protein